MTLNFIVLQITTSFGGAAGGLLQIVGLIVYYVKLYILGSTPRAVFGIKYEMPTVQWGTLVSDSTTLLKVTNY